jgi:hypothetical protein
VTRIRPETVHITTVAELPPRWAAQLGRDLVPTLSEEDAQLLQDRIVSLGHGVELAHLRHHAVAEPTLGAWKATDAKDGSGSWLWLVVLVPAGDPSRHLGWMAHLAAGLHDQECRQTLMAATEVSALRSALDATVTDHGPHRHIKPLDKVPSSVASGAATHRLVIAILKEVEFVDHLLALFVEHDVRGATVIEARGMAEHLAAHMSLFAGFKSAFKAVGHSQVLMTVVPTDRTAEVLDLIRISAGGMTAPGSGIAFAVDVPAVVGLDKGSL